MALTSSDIAVAPAAIADERAPAYAEMKGVRAGVNVAPAGSSSADSSTQHLVAQTDRPIGDWQMKIGGADPARLYPDAPAQGSSVLVRARVSGTAGDDLLIMDVGMRRLRIVETGADKRERSESIAASLAVEDEPVAVLPMRLNRDALDDMVILKKSSSVPTVVRTQAAATFTVNTTSDTDDKACNAAHCSLREAIDAANATPDADMIVFNIPGTGVHTINTTGNFSFISRPVTIDGYTQPGSSPNTLANGDNAVLRIGIKRG